ncbi:TOBE domain-containing protein [Oleomonas cavernae]|uniref:TOBE domain-containing protein n=2 Tax=Oleomonas cavernae TaxID=2320859 RepID=A0A418WB77_9PROT|nr:TOBE domain-containing protein [Oleomonas cavernae]
MRMANRIALMRAGRVVQLGSPEELYNRPVDEGAARFFSEATAFEGTVGADGVVETPLGGVPAPGLAAGSPAEVLIRPHAIRIAPAGAAGVVATVQRARLLGADSLVDVMVGAAGQSVAARLTPPLYRRPGQKCASPSTLGNVLPFHGRHLAPNKHYRGAGTADLRVACCAPLGQYPAALRPSIKKEYRRWVR